MRRRKAPLIMPMRVVSLLRLLMGHLAFEGMFVELRRSFPKWEVPCARIIESLGRYSDSFTLTKESLGFLFDILGKERPHVICEFGSGISTVLFAAYAMENSLQRPVIAFEHDKAFIERTKERLREFGLTGYAELRAYPQDVAAAFPVETGRIVDFVFIDGPPRTVGRAMTLVSISHALKPGGIVVLDDAFREHERMCFSLWRRMGLIANSKLVFIPHGMLIANLTGREIPSKHRQSVELPHG